MAKSDSVRTNLGAVGSAQGDLSPDRLEYHSAGNRRILTAELGQGVAASQILDEVTGCSPGTRKEGLPRMIALLETVTDFACHRFP